MWSDLQPEIEALKRQIFGQRYQTILEHLEKSNLDDKAKQVKRNEFRQLENTFFHLISYIAASQSHIGWWNIGNEFQRLTTAHALRHLHRIGISLTARWNLHIRKSPDGNLFCATDLLVKSFHEPSASKYAMWGDDLWDDCYILMALLEVQPSFQLAGVSRWNPQLENKFTRNFQRSLEWLQAQITEEGFSKQVTRANWYGPGFYAAAIELLDKPLVKKHLPGQNELIKILAAALRSLLEADLKAGASPRWNQRFAWHVGQLLVMWKEKARKYSSLLPLEPMMKRLHGELQKCQSEDGTWDNGGRITDDDDRVYYTVRALSALYVNTPESKICTDRNIDLAHKFLLRTARDNPDGVLVNLKASINAIGALQKLFDFHVCDTFPNLLITLTTRLNNLGLLDDVAAPADSESRMLKGIRATARIRLEEQGRSALELVGVNDRMYASLKQRREFLKEFAAHRNEPLSPKQREETLRDIRRFLSSTLTETRSKYSRKLIASLWQTDGFLNFIPLISHLSDLEQDRAFYKYYRDHLNHEVLLFLFGAYIYYNCATFRDKINTEILKINETNKIDSDRYNLESEFLFRWKLISTFHDVGYLFEVDPDVDKLDKVQRTKEQLLDKSFKVVDLFREQFLTDYFKQYMGRASGDDQGSGAFSEEQENEVTHLASRINLTYTGRIQKAEDLFELTTAGEFKDAFRLISRHIHPKYIGRELVRDYFDMCRSLHVLNVKDGQIVGERRSPFLDHGIMSALVLLKAADIQRYYLKGLTDLNFSEGLTKYPKLRGVLRSPTIQNHLEAEEFFIRFSHVAGAIALHNINPRLYTQEQCREFDTGKDKDGNARKSRLEQSFYAKEVGDEGRYVISLDENPLSYLTALADTLQDWDRHSFRRIGFGEESGDPLSSSEVVIKFSEDEQKIHVRPLTQEASDKYRKLTVSDGMDQYLLHWKRFLKIGDE
jgi:hypothetical protein